MSVFDSLMNPADVGNAFSVGLQRGTQQREEREIKSALSAYAVNPDDPRAFQTLARYKPELAISIGEDRRKRAEKLRLADLQRRAAGGDTAARAEIAGVDLDAWKTLTVEDRARLKDRADTIGQAALSVKSLPPAARAAAWDQQIEYLVANGHPDLAEMRGKYSEQALDGAISGAGLVKDLHAEQEPKYQAVPADAALVNVRDPQAVAAFQSGGGTAPARPSSKAEFDALPPGATFIAPDGTTRQKPGGSAGNGTGGFPR